MNISSILSFEKFYFLPHKNVSIPLDQELKNLASEASADLLIETNKNVMLEALQIAAANESFKKGPVGISLRQILTNLFSLTVNPISLSKADEFLLLLAERQAETDCPIAYTCLELLPIEVLNQWMKAKHGIVESVWEMAKKMEDRLPDELQKRMPQTWKQDFQQTMEQCSTLLISIMNTFVSIFVSWSEGRVPIGNHDKWTVLDMFFKMIMVPILLGMWLKTLFVEQWKAYSVLAIIQLVAIKAIATYVKNPPKPRAIPDCESLTNKAEQNLLKPTIGREEEQKKLIQGLMDYNVSLQPVIVGEPRVGKSKLLEGLAQLIASAPKDSPIKNWCLHVVTPSTVGTGFDSKVAEMRQLLNQIKGNEENTTIIFEEIQESMKQHNWGQFSDSLKKELDARRGIRCIATTTPEGYKALLTDHAFAERFKLKIPVSPLPESDTKLILQTYVHEMVNDVLVDKGAILKVVELTKKDGNCQPDKAQTLLTAACNRIRFNYQLYQPKALIEKRKLLKSLRYENGNDQLQNHKYINAEIQGIIARGNLEELKQKSATLESKESLSIEDQYRLRFLKEKILKIEIALEEENLESTQECLKKIQKIARLYLKVSKCSSALIQKITHCSKDEVPQHLQKEFWTWIYCLQPKLKVLIDKLERQTQVNVQVTDSFVQSVFDEMKKDLETIEKFVASTA